MKVKFYDENGFYLDKPKVMFTCTWCQRKQNPKKLDWFKEHYTDSGLTYRESVIPNRADTVLCKCKYCGGIWEEDSINNSWYKPIKEPTAQEIIDLT